MDDYTMNTPHAPPNGWEAKFGSRRRAIDKALLAECERQIAAQERAKTPQDGRWTSEAAQAPETPEQASWLASEARDRIARAFGRAPS
jgi:hypothetical protein